MLQKGSKFKYMNSLKHLFLIHSKTPILYSNTFQLPNLISLHLQHSQIQYTENGAFCPLTNLRTLNLSFNKLEHISTTTFQCLDVLLDLDITKNKLTTIEEAAFDSIAVVSFSGHSTLCCYLTSTSSCQVKQKSVNSVEIQRDCQSILSRHLLVRVLYFFMGATTTLISIIFMIKRILYQQNGKKINRHIKAIGASDLLNGTYLLLVPICDTINEILLYRTTRRQTVLALLYYLSAFPGLSMVITRVEHLLLTVGMYMAVCHAFSDFGVNIIRVTRLVTWTAYIVSYCVVVIVMRRHAALSQSVI